MSEVTVLYTKDKYGNYLRPGESVDIILTTKDGVDINLTALLDESKSDE